MPQHPPINTACIASAACVVVSTAALCLASCGYGFVAPGASRLPDSARRVAVLELENRTTELQLGTWCTRALHQRILASDRELVAAERAQLVLSGAVFQVTDAPLAFGGDLTGADIEAEVQIQATLIARERGRVVFQTDAEGVSRYTASGTPYAVDAQRRQATRLACAEAMQRGLELLTDALDPATTPPSSPQPGEAHHGTR